MAELDGTVALVTGAAGDRSIGRGIALALARRGADVAVNDVAHRTRPPSGWPRSRPSAAARSSCRRTCPTRKRARGLVEETAGRLGRLDVFCANAGVARWQELADVTPEGFAAIVGVNLHGCFFGCQAAAAADAPAATVAGGSWSPPRSTP